MQQNVVSPDAIRFDHAALLSGRPLYWGTQPQKHTQSLEALIRWCLALPGARLGLSTSDIATVLRDVYSASPELAPADVWPILKRFGANPEDRIQWPFDAQIFDAQIWQRWQLDKLLGWVRQTSQISDHVWVDAQDADWWITATMRSLSSYSPLLASGADSDQIFRLISRHVCTVFAPFDGGATWDHVRRLGDSLLPQQRDGLQEALADPKLDRAHLASIRDVYWSWRLSDFANVDGSIVCTPLLAIWSAWPSSRAWAPPLEPPPGDTPAARNQLTGEEVASLLEGTFWQRIETVFSIARTVCGLGVAVPEFAEIQSRPPVFYFAAPANMHIRPEEYADGLRPAIMPLVKSCLISTDPLAQEVAWGLLEGDLVATRRETGTRRYNQPWYLLLSAFAESFPAQLARSIEDDIATVADRLTYLEFSIGHEARDVYTDIEPLAVRAGMWGGTLDIVNTVTGEVIDLLPSVRKSEFRRINERLAALHLVLRRLQTYIETATSDAGQVDRKYSGYLDGTDDYLRRRMTISWVPRANTLNLRDAILNAYSYQYVKQPLASLHTIMDQLNQGVEHISSPLSTILEPSGQRIRDESARLSGMSTLIFALLALLVGLAQVLGTQANIAPTVPSPAPTSFIDLFFQSPELISAARFLFVGVLLLLIAAAALYCIEWIYQRRPRRRHKFIEAVRRFRAQVSAAGGHQQIDALDDGAVRILAGLWQELRRELEGAGGRRLLLKNSVTPQVRVQGVQEWEAFARLVEHAIELFDLLPRTILLPRALCVLRFKSTDFNSRTAISDWDFGVSLRGIGFLPSDEGTLQSWLSTPANQQRIREMDVATFARALKDRGVTAVPEKRTPARWNGALDETPA